MAQVTTGDIRTRIKNMLDANAIIGAYSPSITVFDIAPLSLNRAILPAIIITDGNGTYDRVTRGKRYIKPNIGYSIAIYAQEWVDNPEMNIESGVIDNLTTEIENTFTEYSNLIYNGEDLKGVSAAYLSSVTAIAPRPYPNISGATIYVSKSFTLQVVYERYL